MASEYVEDPEPQGEGKPETDSLPDPLSSITLPLWVMELLPGTEIAPLKDEYLRFLELNERYLANPADWTVAYNWLEAHPLFWTRQGSAPIWTWTTGFGLRDAWVTVSDDGSTPVVWIEHGGRLEPDCRQHCLDHRLSSVGNTLEDAYVTLARKVNEYYDIEGNSRQDS